MAMHRTAWLALALVACATRESSRTAEPDAALAPNDGAPGSTSGDGGVDGATDADACAEAAAHADLAFLQNTVFTPSCAAAHCHDATTAEVGLRLDAGETYANLVNAAASTQSGWTRVVPGRPTESYLLVALGAQAGPPPRDGFMPLGAAPLCQPLVDAVSRWIAAGAPE
jgi:hypothetical protein